MYIPVHKIARILYIKKELGEIYLNKIIEGFAISMIGIFIPVYLLTLGYPLYVAILFMSISWMTSFFAGPFSGKLSSIVGFKHTILYRAPIFIIFLLMLVAVQAFPSPLPIALIGGISLAMYWVPLNAEFAKNADKIHQGQEIGNLVAMPYMAAMLAPTLAAFILQSLGFPVLFMLVIVLVIFSVVPLFLSSDYKEKGFRIRSFKFFANRRLNTYFFLKGFLYAGEFMMWNILVFLQFGVLVLGIAASLSGLGTIVLTFFMGRFNNKPERRKKLIRIGGIFYALTWITRIFVSTPLEAFILSFIGGLLLIFIWIPVYSLFCDYARDNGILRSTVSREMWLNMGRFLPAMVIGLVLFVNPVPYIFELFFVMAALVSLVFFIIK